MKRLPGWATTASILTAVLVADQLHAILSLFEMYRQMRDQVPFYVRSGARNLLQIAICCGVVRVLWARSSLEVLRELGFNGSLRQGFVFGLAATAPMFIGLGLTSSGVASTAFSAETLYLAGVSPLTEEVVYRGFACGLLFTRGRLPVWLAVTIPGLVFGWGHAEGVASAEQIGLFLYTGGAGIVLGWVYLRWLRNLWVPIAVHVFANLSWEVFDVADSALGGWFPFMLQMTMILVSIAFTLRWTSRIRTPYARPGSLASHASN